jgi:CelD/BcsL family acetyltransferase involved in cellulose biosynthesis
LRDDWDALAEAARLPSMTWSWVTGWLQHLAPPDALPRIVAVQDDQRLVGLAPFFVTRGAGSRADFRLPSGDFGGQAEPLAEPGREWEVAEAITAVLSEASPRPDTIALDALPICSHWVTTLRHSWPGSVQPFVRWHVVNGSLSTSVAGHTLDSWLATKSSHFRERARKARRRFERAGGTHRLATPDTIEADVATLMRLHATRWQANVSSVTRRTAEISAMLRAVGRTVGSDRFRLRVLELDGEPVCAYLAIAAGGELLGLTGGWDERWGRLSPFLVYAVYLIEDAVERGDLRIDLGPGTQAYKNRVAEANNPVGSAILLPPSSRLPLTALQVAPMLVRDTARQIAKRTLGEERREQLNVLMRRPSASRS